MQEGLKEYSTASTAPPHQAIPGQTVQFIVQRLLRTNRPLSSMCLSPCYRLSAVNSIGDASPEDLLNEGRSFCQTQHSHIEILCRSGTGGRLLTESGQGPDKLYLATFWNRRLIDAAPSSVWWLLPSRITPLLHSHAALHLGRSLLRFLAVCPRDQL